MTGFPLRRWAAACLAVLPFLSPCSPASLAQDKAPASDPGGVLPTDPSGRPLNLGFEDGTLRDWTPEGDAFQGQPVEGDTVTPRRSDMKSAHAGKFWIGTFERQGDRPTGTLTSVSFNVTHPWCSFLVAGGPHRDTGIELVRADTQKAFYRVSGDETEELKRVSVDLKDHVGKPIFIRVFDGNRGHWGHVNFDDFRFHDAKPSVPTRNAPPPADVYAHSGLSPEDAAKAMTVPDGFRVTPFAGEPDVIQPIAMTIDEKGRLWVVEAYTYPIRLPEGQGKDRVLIFEDADNDGKFDSRKVFAENLNLVSGIEVGFGGVWLGAAPYLLFIPDKNADDTPDGPAQVLLDGWGYQDTHETLNSFIWGPDGWLYGCHGVFTHARVGKPGTPDAERVPLNAGIWRYHPTRHEFEVFAHGTSNPWGVDFDERGQCIIEACVIPHLYHMIQGGRYERQAGQHFNPYTYDDIKTIADHRHYVGANPHGGNGRSDSAGGGHAHAGLISYQGDAWPKEFRGSLLMNNIHGARLNRDLLTPSGSGFVGTHAPDFLLANDAWSQIVYFRSGPDGNLYMIDWYDQNQCHRTETNVHDRSNGRVFKVSYGPPRKIQVDLSRLASPELVALLLHPNSWHSRTAQRLLQERGPHPETHQALDEIAFSHPDPVRRLRGLWTLSATDGLTDDRALRALQDNDPHVRAWAVQLATERGTPSRPILDRFASLAKADPSPVVRLYLASAAQRLGLKEEARWAIVDALAQHAEDRDDHNLPLMTWYALEPLAGDNPSRALEIAGRTQLPRLLEFTVRRVAALGTDEAFARIVEPLQNAGSDRLTILKALNQALQGRRQVKMPESWPDIMQRLLSTNRADLYSETMALALTFGDPRALNQLRVILDNRELDPPQRLQALAALRKARPDFLADSLRGLLNDPALRGPALRALSDFDDAATPAAIVRAYASFDSAGKRDALNTLASRPAFASALLDAVESRAVASKDLTADIIRQLRNLKDARLDARINEVWGQVRESSADKARLIADWKTKLSTPAAREADPLLGRAVFTKACGQCHKLFATGGDIGPELTGSDRANLDYVLQNVMDPSALIGKDYQAQLVATADGRVLTGLVRAEDDNALTLVTANETVVLPKNEIDDRKLSDQSMMPEDLWNNLTDHEIRSLVAYLASPGQVPLLATAETAPTLFNGKDLTGWTGNLDLWSVENGELVGKSPGLKHNEFLKSDLAASDFILTLKVKISPNSENSGIQFRSEAQPDGEVKGYQADIGQGWWGKLYEELGRALLWDKSGESYIKPGDWNEYRIEAQGSKIRTFLNGQPCVDLNDPPGAKRGIFAFQLHAGGPLEVRFKDIKLEVLDAPSGPTTARAGSEQ